MNMTDHEKYMEKKAELKEKLSTGTATVDDFKEITELYNKAFKGQGKLMFVKEGE